MKETKTNSIEDFLTILVGVFAILTLKSIFDNDDSKIISKKGKNYLSDDTKMEEINKQIKNSENEEIIIK